MSLFRVAKGDDYDRAEAPDCTRMACYHHSCVFVFHDTPRFRGWMGGCDKCTVSYAVMSALRLAVSLEHGKRSEKTLE